MSQSPEWFSYTMFKTQRLHIRELELSDLNNIHILLSLPETDEFNALGIPESIQITEKYFSEWGNSQKQSPRISYIFSIDLIHTNQFIGLIALIIGKPKYNSAEVWFKIHKDYWNNGYTTEALNRLIEFGFNELKLHRIEAGCAVENIASRKVLEKVGMTKEGMSRKKLPIRGQWKDNYSYSILEEEFAKAGSGQSESRSRFS